ncbi:MAG: type II toxin-antitoxin system HicB family antitoxin [Hyphomicrobiales bacterium]
MPHYIALVHKDKNSAFGVEFPDIPGCYSAADSMDALIANAAEALSLWAEDADLPPPRDVGKITALRDVAVALAEGAFLVSVPYSPNDTRVVTANISLERGVLKAIDEAAKQRKLTRSAFLAQAAKNEINR